MLQEHNPGLSPMFIFLFHTTSILIQAKLKKSDKRITAELIKGIISKLEQNSLLYGMLTHKKILRLIYKDASLITL